jgi:type I restriction enzyme S subunit
MAIWDGQISGCVHQNHIIRARLLGGTLPAYTSAYWNAPNGSQCVFDIASSTSGLYTLSVSKVSHIPVPLPPLAEQHRIVAEVERRLSVIDELEALVAANLKRAERLRQSILKRAFEGKLVPQDPNDEPASVLLERIRAERATAGERAASREGGNRTKEKRS